MLSTMPSSSFFPLLTLSLSTVIVLASFALVVWQTRGYVKLLAVLSAQMGGGVAAAATATATATATAMAAYADALTNLTRAAAIVVSPETPLYQRPSVGPPGSPLPPPTSPAAPQALTPNPYTDLASLFDLPEPSDVTDWTLELLPDIEAPRSKMMAPGQHPGDLLTGLRPQSNGA